MDATKSTATSTPTTRRGLLARLGASLGAGLALAIPGRAGAAAAAGRGRGFPERIAEDLHPDYLRGVRAVWTDQLQSSQPNGRCVAEAARLCASHFAEPEPAADGGPRARDLALWRDGRLVGIVRVGHDGQPVTTIFED